MVKWNAFLRSLCGFAVAFGVMAGVANANTTTERGSSIIVFPKVIADGTFNTTIQITNISNDVVYARCFYVNAQLSEPELPPDPILNPPLWQEIDFEIRLTRQQPTHWDVLRGRPVNPLDNCQPGSSPTCIDPGSGYIDIGGLGIDPGAVPPVPNRFVGELKCVETDISGAPLGGNHLKGEATIFGTDPTGDGANAEADVSKYNAIGHFGTQLVGATGDDLQLSNPSGEDVGMYDACPDLHIINHFAYGAENPFIVNDGRGRRCSVSATPCTDDSNCPTGQECVQGGECENGTPCVDNSSCGGGECLLSGVYSNITIAPCAEDLENQIPASVTLQFRIYNEFEQFLSASTTVTCWVMTDLDELGRNNAFTAGALGTTVAQTFMRPADTKDGGVYAVLEEKHRDIFNNVTRAAMNVHTSGNRFYGEDGQQFDHIILPSQF